MGVCYCTNTLSNRLPQCSGRLMGHPGGGRGLHICALQLINRSEKFQHLGNAKEKTQRFKIYFRKLLTFHRFSGYIAILAIVYRYK